MNKKLISIGIILIFIGVFALTGYILLRERDLDDVLPGVDDADDYTIVEMAASPSIEPKQYDIDGFIDGVRIHRFFDDVEVRRDLFGRDSFDANPDDPYSYTIAYVYKGVRKSFEVFFGDYIVADGVTYKITEPRNFQGLREIIA